MLLWIRKKIYSILQVTKKGKLKYEAIKICLIYLIIGFFWIYFSDRIINKFASDRDMLTITNICKGWLYVIITAIILYLLVTRILKKVDFTEEKLKESYEELSVVNRKLEEHIQQLTASEEELRIQYDQIIENEKKLIKSEEKNRTIIKAIPDLLFIINNDGYIIDCMANDESLLLMKKQSFVGKNFWKVIPKGVLEVAHKKVQSVIKFGVMESFEYKLKIYDKLYYFELRMVKNNEKEILAISRNITAEKQNENDRKQMENKLEYLSYHDQLTGLYNRRFFEKKLKLLDKEESIPLTIVVADVNGLKLVNDSFGHAMGDELLKKVTDVMIKGCPREYDVARLSGDEFVILMPNTHAYEAAKIIRDIKALASKEKVGSVDISVSFGYETKNNKEEKIEDVLKKADDHMYRKKLFESRSMRGKTISAIITTLHEKNKREEQHSYRVSRLCESMGKALDLPEDEIKELKIVGLLHDIGKIAIEENILNKSGKLTYEEWEQIKRHPEIGYRILNTTDDMSEMAKYVLAHHEKWNGTGYPRNLKGKAIPLQSRIIAIADSYDAMISERSYRNALPENVAIEELKINAGIQFDPELIKVFIEKVLNK